MDRLQDELRAYVDAFTADLTALVHASALEAVGAALGRATAPRVTLTPAPKAQPAPPTKAPSVPPAKAPARRGRPAKPAVAKERRPGSKRDPRELAEFVERLATYIQANPGQRIERISQVLAVPSKDLTLPIRRLVAGKRIMSRGEKRATTYSPK